MSQYLVLLYDSEQAWAEASPETYGRMLQEHNEFQAKNEANVQGGDALQPSNTATSIRPDGAGGFTVTDGPFVETKEALGGYYLIEAADLDEAIGIAKQVPLLAGGLEVRPLMVFN